MISFLLLFEEQLANIYVLKFYFKVLPISKNENAITLCMKIHETIYPCFLEVLNSDKVNFLDGDGNSLLHMAVKILKPDLCSTLIKAGSNVEAMNEEGNSPLFELFSNVDNPDDVIMNILLTILTFYPEYWESNSDIEYFGSVWDRCQ